MELGEYWRRKGSGYFLVLRTETGAATEGREMVVDIFLTFLKIAKVSWVGGGG